MHFSNSIIGWYLNNKRELPWRDTNDPYKIWVSEIILQQTRVNQGINYYHRFLDAFPTVHDLASSDTDLVLKMWEGLGYYSRARNMHAAAKQLMNEYNGVFPSKYESIIKLKGVGEYTAAAIASIAFREAVAVVDGNVYRVLGRFLGIDADITSAKGKKLYRKAANDLLDSKQPDLFNQAIMEFGALHCTVHQPKCDECVLNKSCVAYNNKEVANFPVKLKKTKVRNRYFYYIIIYNGKKQFCIQKREQKDIWQNLYEFPLIETDHREEVDTILNTFSKNFPFKEFDVLKVSQEIRHVLSHQRLYTRFIHIEIKNTTESGKLFCWKTEGEMAAVAFPRLIDRYIKEHIL